MMCLGWFNQMDCATRPYVEVVPGTVTAAEAAGITTGSGNAGDVSASGTGLSSACPSSLWFWIGAAVIVGAGVLKK